MNVLVIDSHPLALTAASSLGQQLGEGVEIVIASTAQASKSALAVGPAFDLTLVDLDFGAEDRLALLDELRHTHPSMPVVVVADSGGDRHHLLRAVEAGAIGFLPKGASNETLLSSLVVLLSEQIRRRPSAPPPLPPSPSAGRHRRATPLGREVESQRAAATIATLDLTPRQKQVLELLVRGKSNKLIARALDLSVETVKNHVTGVLRALGVESRMQAVVAVSQLATPAPAPPWLQSSRALASSLLSEHSA